jgi:hypothetical protein
MSREFNPIVSSTSDGSDLTLCRILESVAVGGSLSTGFAIPAYNDVVMLYENASFPTKPTFITFKQDGTIVYEVTLTYDANGALTRVYES